MSRCTACWPSLSPCTQCASMRAFTPSWGRSTETRCCECRKGKKETAQCCVFFSMLIHYDPDCLCLELAKAPLNTNVPFFMSETCRCLRSCSVSPVRSFCHRWCPTTTTSTPTTTKSLSSSSWRSLLRRCSSRPSCPPFAGRTCHPKPKSYSSKKCFESSIVESMFMSLQSWSSAV